MYNAREIEKKWQERWQKSKIFEANPKPGTPKKFITIPYPYASGPQHIGHGRSYANGDIFARYYRAKGYNVLLPMAFHITGTPVLAISSAIERNDKKIIKRMHEYVSLHTSNKQRVKEIVKSFVDPWNIVYYFSDAIREDFIALGMSIDWRREFTTGDAVYNKFIEWQFQKLMDKGYIEKGAYPILYCPRDKNAVGEDDIASGDELDLNINEFTCIKFPYEDGYLVAATLRPETIFGVTNIWINPNGTYVYIKINGEQWVISEEAITLFRNQGKNIEILEKFPGKILIGKQASSINSNRKLPILPGDFVDTSTATGVVYSVPAHAPYDYIALIDLQKNEKVIEQYSLDMNKIKAIRPIQIIELKNTKSFPAKDFCEKYGVESQLDKDKLDNATAELYKSEFYNGILNEKCGRYSNKPVNDAVKEVVQDLTEEGSADKLYIPVTRNLRCRCGEKIIVTILEDQWFLNFNSGDWKKKAFDCLEQMQIVPKKYRQNFVNVFHWLEKRPCARKRGLGTKLPFDKNWIIESLSDSTIYMSFYTIIHIINKHSIQPEQLIQEFFDFVFLSIGKVDSVSVKTGIKKAILEEMHAEFTYWYPVDHRHTAIMHISNHLSFFIFHHAAIFPKKNWPRLITLIEPVIVEGQKMGKSKGNLISLAELRKSYSIDLFRFYISHGADLGVSVDWRESKIKSISNHIDRFYNFISENLNQDDLKDKKVELDKEYPKAILSKTLRFFIASENALKEYNLRKYIQIAFYEVFNLLQDFKKYSENKDFHNLFDLIVFNWLKILSLVIPHVCEELWEKAGKSGFISNEIWAFFDKSLIHNDLESNFDYISELIDDIFNIKKIANVQANDAIFIYTAPDWKYNVQEKIISYEGEFNNIISELRQDQEIMKRKELMPFIKMQIKNRIWEKNEFTDKEDELLLKYKEFIEKRINQPIFINSEHDPTNKRSKAIPNKPAIYIGEKY